MSQPTPNPSGERDPDPPPTVSYRRMSTRPARSRPSIGLFILGVLTGTVASIAIYAATIQVAPRIFLWALASLIAGKIIFGIHLLGSRRLSSFGKGILCSIGLVTLLMGVGLGAGVVYVAYACGHSHW